MKNLREKYGDWALVTGASAWIGEAFAHSLARAGLNLILVARRRGAVVFVASVAGYQPTPFMSTYSATKAFNLFMGEGLWYELKPYGIDVLALSPGTTDTEFQATAGMSHGPLVATAEEVVDSAMRALGRRPSVVDGRINGVLAFLHRVLPRRVALILAGRILGQFHLRGR